MTMPNFTQYVAPGVYWQQNAVPMNVQAAGLPNGIALYGPGIGYCTFSEAITLTSTTPATLSKKGINTATVVVTGNGLTYSVSTDYSISTTGSGNSTVTTIARQSGSTITSGATVTVSYQYTDASYTTPTQVSNSQAVVNLYGPPFDPTTGNLVSPVSLAASIAILNGANNVTIAATTTGVSNTTEASLLAALNTLSTLDTVSIIVPLPVGITTQSTIQAVGSDLQTFISNQISVNDLLIGILGWENGTATASIDPAVNIASHYVNERIVVAYPNSMTFPINNSSIQVPGYYLAAAYAGVISSNPVQQGLTRQKISGFSGIDPAVFATMTTTQKNTWSAGGVAVTEIDRTGNLVVRHGVTSDNTSLFNREISLVRSQDDVIDSIIQAVVNGGMIGSPITNETAAQLAGVVNVILSNALAQGVIAGFSNVSVVESNSQPTIMNVSFLYEPSYPLNYVAISFGIDTTTGAVTTGTTAG